MIVQEVLIPKRTYHYTTKSWDASELIYLGKDDYRRKSHEFRIKWDHYNATASIQEGMRHLVKFLTPKEGTNPYSIEIFIPKTTPTFSTYIKRFLMLEFFRGMFIPRKRRNYQDGLPIPRMEIDTLQF